jgi:hypothetical protein
MRRRLRVDWPKRKCKGKPEEKFEPAVLLLWLSLGTLVPRGCPNDLSFGLPRQALSCRTPIDKR